MLSEERIKECPGCKEKKALDAFAVSSRYKDGRQSRCRECMAKYYAARKQEIRARQKETWQAYSTGNREHLIEKNKQRRLCNKEKDKKYRDEYRQIYAPKIAAKTTLHSHVLTGRVLKQPCEVCGEQKADAHHDDYAEPLKVRWLCRKHHSQWHADNGEGKNGTTEQASM